MKMPLSNPICIYHGKCADGFTAAYSIWKWHQWTKETSYKWEFYAGVHGQPFSHPLEYLDGRDVFIVDFSYGREVIIEMCKHAKHVFILDHHKTAIERLQGLNIVNLVTVFDLDRSGAGITWDYFNWDYGARPALINYVEDRDLWKFELPHSREFSSMLFSYEYSFELWDEIFEGLETDTYPDASYFTTFVAGGAAIDRKHLKDIRELLDVCTRHIAIGNWRNVPVANLPYTLANDGANMLSKGVAFGASYYINKDGNRIWSLRSDKDGVDVSAIASKFGGGGHYHAAGFQSADSDAAVKTVI